LPPLRERGEDIRLLARHLLQELNRADPSEETDKRLDDNVIEALLEYTWPGNVRELKNVVHSAFILSDRTIGVNDLPAEVVAGRRPGSSGSDRHTDPAGDPAGPTVAAGTTIADAERHLIEATLEECGGNRTRAAEMLGISVKTLYNRLKEYGTREE
jgi:DNA-binding NtrC family response regulator